MDPGLELLAVLEGDSVPVLLEVPVVPYVLPVEVELGDDVAPLRLPEPLVLPAALPLSPVSVELLVLAVPEVPELP